MEKHFNLDQTQTDSNLTVESQEPKTLSDFALTLIGGGIGDTVL